MRYIYIHIEENDTVLRTCVIRANSTENAVTQGKILLDSKSRGGPKK